MVALNPPFVCTISEQSRSILLMHLIHMQLYGPAIHEVNSVSALNESLSKLYDTVVARTRSNERLANEFQVTFDVRDTAQLIVDSTSHPDVGGQRYMLGDGPIWDQKVGKYCIGILAIDHLLIIGLL
jgi:hypothetical protein